MLRAVKNSWASSIRTLLRSPARLMRRTAPSLIGLEQRALLSVQAVEIPFVQTVRPEAVDGETRRPEAAKVNQQVRFVDSVFKTYYHRASPTHGS